MVLQHTRICLRFIRGYNLARQEHRLTRVSGLTYLSYVSFMGVTESEVSRETIEACTLVCDGVDQVVTLCRIDLSPVDTCMVFTIAFRTVVTNVILGRTRIDKFLTWACIIRRGCPKFSFRLSSPNEFWSEGIIPYTVSKALPFN